MMYFVGFLFIILLLNTGLTNTKEDKYVEIGLDAKWAQTPLVLEISEYIASKSNDNFWKFILDVQGISTSSDKDSYVDALTTASKILSETDMDALKFALSIRAYSPRVQLFQQMGLNLQAGCDFIYQSSDGKSFCNLEAAIANTQKAESSTASLLEADHIYPESEDGKNLLIVYADIRTSHFHKIHEELLLSIKSNDLKYVLRHHYKIVNADKVGLSGFGVELAVKSTEYMNVDDQNVTDSTKKGKAKDVEQSGDDEVEGFLFNTLRKLHPALQNDLDQFKAHLKESNKELAPLRVWQLQDLSFQAAQRVMTASTQTVLNVLTDISQNVPMVARSLVKTSVNEEMRNEIKQNQEEFQRLGMGPGDARMFVNGIEMDSEELDAFKLLQNFQDEANTMSRLNSIDLDPVKVSELLALNARPDEESLVVDTRSESVQWLNDLENDQRYHYWPSNLQEILRPTFPGMLRYIAKNIFHVVAYIDPLSEDGRNMFRTINELLENSVPVRFGFVFVSGGSVKDTASENPGAALLRAFSFIKSDKSLADAFNFLDKVYRTSGRDAITSDIIIELFTSWYGESEAGEQLGPDSEYDDLRRVSKKVFDNIGLKSLPQVLVNGEQLGKDELQFLESSVTEKVLSQTPSIQQAVYVGSHYGYPSIYEYLMSQSNVVHRLNSIIQTLGERFVHVKRVDKDVEDLFTLSKEESTGLLMNKAKYFVQDNGVTIWVVANAETEDGRELIKNAMHYIQKQKNARLAIILHGPSTESATINWNDVIQIVLNLRQKLISGVGKLVIKILEDENDVTEIIKEEKLTELAAGITGINKMKLLGLLSSEDAIKIARETIQENALLVNRIFKLQDDQQIVMANGRVLGPLKGADIFVLEDFELLQSYENNRCAFKITEKIEAMNLPKLPADGHDRYKSDLVMMVSSIMTERKDKKRNVLRYSSDKHSVINLPSREDSISFDVEAILDPLSKGAQKLAPILKVLYEAFNVNLKIFMNCKEKHSEMPVNRFYHFVLQSELKFSDNGKLLQDRTAVFKNLPHSALLTTIMDTPQSWMIEAVGSNQDLDNIHLGQATDVVYGYYDLEYIIIEGHCSDGNTHQPPRGLQFTLGTERDPEMFDTIVMANLGYFQLKAFPGSFVLQLRDGRSSQIYEIEKLDGGKELAPGQNYTIVIDDFSGKFLKAKVKRRPGQERADLLEDKAEEQDEDSWGILDSISKYVKSEKSTKNTDGKIHIFSVATGLLYERFLRIMMLSVLNHTKTPVKFWFLKNYLSSNFIQFLPHYAEHYGFEYELVQYQWPRWLNGQTEKQRIIWGYKILFLDVLFPLNLERIVFVDADQIVRADLKELMDMDLDGAPYAYTPFCNDRAEVEGFRFWNHGYWKNHLAGRPYHISALYVIDLKRFRRVAAGDRLRGQYQGLSQDPNSLANLDQDLPNNMIHQVQIKSLPQEWLWCETWCSDESKTKAKTIDMCNNPQTKEPKLQRAMRIAPEWTTYDEIIRKLLENIANNVTTSKQETALPIKVEL